MKKRLILFLVLISTFFLIENVQAIEIDKDDIETGSYVIGTHLFERKVTEHYDGTLTVQHIMLAAQSIGSNDIKDMVIYLKNSRGKWVDGLTNEVIPVPEEFKIEYRNVEKLPVNISYGDVYVDGVINTTDITHISRYLLGYEVPKEVNLANADVNNDGKISNADVVLLRKYKSGNYPDANLPNKPLGKSYTVEYMIGDKNNTYSYAVDYELEGQTLKNNQKPDDPTKKGYKFA